MMDFTLKTYEQLMKALLDNGYQFLPMEKWGTGDQNRKTVILRHDVDTRPHNSLRTSLIENRLGICGTYYFRIVSQSFDRHIIRQIARLGHEIGYHYEDLALAKGDQSIAIKLFEKHLNQFREICEIKTICMHGSPMSRFDNRIIWKKHRYADYGIICEPYFDIDFTRVLYLTDTGRMWDGKKVSVRDKEQQMDGIPLSSSYRFHSTAEIIEAGNEGRLPDRLMLNFHPQRWNADVLNWSKELVFQQVKNQVKRVLVRRMEMSGS